MLVAKLLAGATALPTAQTHQRQAVLAGAGRRICRSAAEPAGSRRIANGEPEAARIRRSGARRAGPLVEVASRPQTGERPTPR
jgi:hypothetical protein